ncbi:MAG: alkane 1-monooxygenase [Bacteroidota bacterium]
MTARIKLLKYLSAFTLPLTMAIALSLGGWWSFLPFVYVFGLIPGVELFLKPQPINLTAAEEALAKADPFFDWLLYLTIPTQLGFLAWYLISINTHAFEAFEYVGLVLSMGIMCGVFGINVGHELGHRTKNHEIKLAKIALASSLYMHFYIEHNRGHHKRVATYDDPATARLGENIFVFWIRSITFSFLSAWEIEAKRLKKKSQPWFSLHNEMLQFMFIQACILIGIAILFSIQTMAFFILAALVGILLLETVNYIEHYGLQRTLKENGRFERTNPHHSWNSNHVIGRLMLFELSRHSDHHYEASRKYQVLRHHDESPQMPTGYPGMMVMALMPPLWFYVMHRRLDAISTEVEPTAT